MTAHDHREFVPGCFRCDLSREEVPPTLTDFLLARITEDEGVAREVQVEREVDHPYDLPMALEVAWGAGVNAEPFVQMSPARTLAECKAKRQIVASCSWLEAWVLMLLALPYADHRDYRDEWKP